VAERGGAAGPGGPAGFSPAGGGDPERVGPYRILGRLGAGGMGTVFLGRADDGPRVAVKVLRPELAADPSFLRMFRHEVAAARRVVGFCTAKVLDADTSGPLPYLVTEYVEGPRLDRAIAASGRLPGTDLQGLAVGMAAALVAIHGAGVVHRDLKPSNVLLSYFGPKVIDFGIARALDASASTATGKLMGSPGWMAPEQFRQQPVTAAVDIFVWGSLVAFAGTGRRPFGQGTVVEIVGRIRDGRPDLEGLDGGLRELVERCMVKEPAQRPSAKALLLELLGDRADPDPQASATQLLRQRWAPPAAAIQPPPPPPPPPAIRPRPRRRRRGRRLALLGLVMVAAAAALVIARPELLDRAPLGQAVPGPAATSGRPAEAAAGPTRPADPPPLCELLGDLGGGGELGARPPTDRGFEAAGDAAAGWLPEPAALARALEDHGFQSGCARTWARTGGPVLASLFQFPSRTDALAMRGQLRDDLGRRGVRPGRVPQVTGGELYLLAAGGGRGQLVMFVCNERVLQIHLPAVAATPDPLLVRLAQGSNRRLSERTGCPL
jgi:eukaryotic-like serine/threonine-protein kinase